MGRRPQSIGEEFGGGTIRDDPELGTYFLKPPKYHISIHRFSYWARDPRPQRSTHMRRGDLGAGSDHDRTIRSHIDSLKRLGLTQ